MKGDVRMGKITTTIKRQWLDLIVSGKKRTEYRDIKPYWDKRLAQVHVPFRLRLINGMRAKAPEVTVEIAHVRRNMRSKQYELAIGKIISYKNCSRGNL
jgi:hypothetical protein